MELTGEQLIPAPRAKVWDALYDPDILRQCIAGCETVTKTSDSEFEATVQVKVGPVKAKFKGKVTLTDLDPPNSCTIQGEAQGGVAAGFGKGNAKVQLADAQIDGAPGGATKLTYSVQAQVGGKLAQIGARLIDGVAAKMAEDFFAKLTRSLPHRKNRARHLPQGPPKWKRRRLLQRNLQHRSPAGYQAGCGSPA